MVPEYYVVRGPRTMHIHFYSLNSAKQGAIKIQIYDSYPAKQFESHDELFVDSEQDWSEEGVGIVKQYSSTSSFY